jgi:uncharacterized membrane protein YedE/YeeE
MLDPMRVLGFLDVAGAWDPSLAFVLAGAVVVSAGGYRVSRRPARPALARTFDIPAGRRIDPRLIGGAALFSVGWGMAGFCPGPAIASLSLGCGKSVCSWRRCWWGWQRSGSCPRRRAPGLNGIQDHG